MTTAELLLADASTRKAFTAGIDVALSPTARDMAAFVASAAGPSALAVIHYGSHAQRSDAQPESAYDFFLIVTRYRDAYLSLNERIGTSYNPRLAAALNRVLPPNVIAVTRSRAPRVLAKVAVLSLDDLRRAASPRARDHFVAGRLFQQVQLAWAKDDTSRDAMMDAVAAIRLRTIEWGGPYLPRVFDAATYSERLLRRSYASEVRPEVHDRVTSVLAAQREWLIRQYDVILRALAAAGVVKPATSGYTHAVPLRRRSKWRRDVYFFRSKWRAIARWLKYIALYDDWVDYLAQKISRRAGMHVELTERERRFPFVFLWPKVYRYLRTRPPRPRPPAATS